MLLSLANSSPTLAVTAAITAVQSTGFPFNVLITAELTATTAVRIPEIVVFQLDKDHLQSGVSSHLVRQVHQSTHLPTKSNTLSPPKPPPRPRISGFVKMMPQEAQIQPLRSPLLQQALSLAWRAWPLQEPLRASPDRKPNP